MKILKTMMIALLGGMGVAEAQLASWNTTPLAGNNVDAAATSLGTNVDSAMLARGAGATVVSYNNTFAMRNGNSADLATAISNDRYLSFTVDAGSGYALDVSSVFFRATSQDTTLTNIRNWSLFSDHTGFTTSDVLSTLAVTGGGAAPATQTVDLSANTALQGVSSVEFRLYVWGLPNAAFAQNGIGRAFGATLGDDLVVNGTTSVIPEPGMFALALLGFALLLRFRRKE
jgi:hypothetical protein